MANYTQDNRVFTADTPLGGDVLLLKSFDAESMIDDTFRVVLNFVSTRDDVDPADVLGEGMTLRVELPHGDDERFMHGLVRRFSQLGRAGDLSHYQAELAPWFWFLKLSTDCRVFQNMTVEAICSQVFGDLGYTDYEFRLTGSLQEREYCVQYRETHFDFVSRLLEEEGLFYFFEHSDGQHVLVMSDDNTAFAPMPGQDVAQLSADGIAGYGEDVLADLQADHSVHSGRATLADFDFLKPKKSLRTATVGEDGPELYDYPGRYKVVKHGESSAEQIVTAHQAKTEHVVANGSVRALQPGYRLAVEDHFVDKLNTDYVVLSVMEHGDGGDFRAGGDGPSYRSRFVGMPWSNDYRPIRKTPRPIIHGTQTAIVVGPSGEEIYTDEHGRVKLQFHWDRVGSKDENSSCWVRVSYAWAGEGWGAIHLPRIGQEVIVEFLEGDPDRPIVTGRVYNGEQTVPYSLPANKTQSGLKSRSSKEGAAANFNEIRMEDKKGSELLYIHAEKDKEVTVEHDRTEEVGNDERITIARNRTESVGKDETIKIAENRREEVGKDETIEIGANRTESVGADESVNIGGSRDQTIGKDLTVSIGTNATIDVGKDLEESVGGKYKESVGKEYVLQAKKVQIVAKDEISFKAGKAKVVMKKNGDITINGKKITIKGSGDVVLKGSKIAAN